MSFFATARQMLATTAVATVALAGGLCPAAYEWSANRMPAILAEVGHNRLYPAISVPEVSHRLWLLTYDLAYWQAAWTHEVSVELAEQMAQTLISAGRAGANRTEVVRRLDRLYRQAETELLVAPGDLAWRYLREFADYALEVLLPRQRKEISRVSASAVTLFRLLIMQSGPAPGGAGPLALTSRGT